MWLRKSLRWRTVIRLVDSIEITRIKTQHIVAGRNKLISFILHLSDGILRAGVVRETGLTAIDYTVSTIFYNHLCILSLMYSAKLSTECTRDDSVITFFLDSFLIHQTVCGKRLRVLILLGLLLLFSFDLFLVTFASLFL